MKENPLDPLLALSPLLPCPFCGERAILHSAEDEDAYHWWVQCSVCGAVSGERLAESTPDQEFAIAAWNARAGVSDLPKLPEPMCLGFRNPCGITQLPDMGIYGYTAEQMTAYGQQCAATRPVSDVPAKRASDYADGEYGPADLAAIWNACRSQHLRTHPAEVGGDGWLPIESAPEDGTPILIAAMEDGQLFDVLHGHFEVLAEDEDDGPWDVRDGEPWCSYEGRSAGVYFCHWLPEKEWESRWKFGPNTGYTHWQLALTTTPESN